MSITHSVQTVVFGILLVLLNLTPLRFSLTKNYSIFVRPKDKTKEIWNGKRLGVKSAPKALLADNAYSIDDFLKTIHKLIDKNKSCLFR